VVFYIARGGFYENTHPKEWFFLSEEELLTGKSGLRPEFVEKYDLTKRQADVTQALLLGKADREIAALLEIGLNTVKTHLKKVYKKTGVRGRCALMALVGVGNK
jgi:DNA-binding CsgD family transcriptional regulator